MNKAREVAHLAPEFPPGPRWPRLLQTALLATQPDLFSRYCRWRFGETFTVRLWGIGEVVVVTRPQTIRDVFLGDRDVFHAGEANAVLGPMVGRNSLMLLDGERHLRHRKMLTGPFHGEAVHAYRERVVEISAAEAQSWPLHQEMSIRPRMQAITLEVILKVVIGVSDEHRLARLRELLTRITRLGIVEMWLTWASPRFASRTRVRALTTLKAMPEIDRLLFEEISAHRQELSNREGLSRRKDVLSQLIEARDEDGNGLNDEELRDHLITLLVAGHETTTTALAWCFERLLRHPQALQRLRAEIKAGEEDAYLDAVISETLRGRPVIVAVWRKLTQPAVVEGRLLPASATVVPSITLVHGSQTFEHAQEFRPERFLEDSVPPYTFIPFGGGPRRCIGASFATMEMKAVISTVLAMVDLRAPDQKPERAKVHHVTLVPARGGRVIVTARRGGDSAEAPTAAARG